MPYIYTIYIISAAALAIVIAWSIYRHAARRARRAKLLTQPIPPQWQAILEKNIPLYARLPEELKTQLQGLINVFLAEKTFEGCSGQEITDQVRVTIAAQACLLLLNRPTRYYPKLKTVYVYPSSYVASELKTNGLIGPQARQGESWQNGPVVLAWNSVTGGAQNITDGQNVVFHEFSHRLDQEDGNADGAPILESRNCYGSWAVVLSTEYKALQSKAKKYRRSVLRRYGATHPAEFFAVATEAFFEKPKQMKKRHPDLYDELKQYYKVDPIEWK